MTFHMDDTIYENGKEVRFVEDSKGNITYTIITSEDESSEDPFIHSEEPEDLYYTNCADDSENEWEQLECDTHDVDPDLIRLAKSIQNHNNSISSKYFHNPDIARNMLGLQSDSCTDIHRYNHSNNRSYRNSVIVKPELIRVVDRFLSSKYACSSRDVSKPAGEFLRPVLSNRATYNTIDGAFIYNKIGLLDGYFHETDGFDDIVNSISERLALFA